MDRPSRRRFLQGGLALAGLGLLSGCGQLPFQAQQPAKVPVIGFLTPGTREDRAPHVAGLLQGLSEHGYVEGQNILIEYRFSEDRNDRLPELAAELVGLRVDIILASATFATIAAKQATTTIPIVMVSGEPVATGLVAGLAHPGGNVTRMALMSAQTSGKRLELLKEIIPGLSRVAVISNETNPLHVPQDSEIQAAAQALGLQIHILSVRSADDLAAAFQAATSARADAIYGATDATVVINARAQLAELAMRHRLPTMFDYRENVDAGGLMAYGPVFAALYRHAAGHVDKILKGAKPAEIPVEQPTQFELFINAKTARALGLTVPASILGLATEVGQ
jgi:putative ABC transport system substrate-binding protein